MRLLRFLQMSLVLPHLCCYLFTDEKIKIDKDIDEYLKNWNITKNRSQCINVLQVIIQCKEYRNIFYLRISDVTNKLHINSILFLFLRPYRLLSIGTKREHFGGGAYVEHGNSTIIHAHKIGDNLWVNQNVTIGDSGKGTPTIGNNVRIGTGAVVLGPITVGDNVIIGANTTIVKNVPDNCTVVSGESWIIKQNGIKTRIKL